ncbi:hypothetical protein ETQ85_04035 [Zoogloea oleivorans]|jgi:hypothetical protein|uniref:Uncharacterized protein n=1 Tax=Zoogloea oleivorans TaxID=1552750 RepID=A0A6C2D4L3_9RHOO|nr:hypothetical protein [Zoogloea oleivorans]TYC61237.1 hypothetical protein ETQ85_04035 [Zoogloea oleivorans]
MSNTQFAFLKKSQAPSRAALQASIDALGFDLKLDPTLNLLEDSGFSPCVLAGISDVGFELFTEPAKDLIGDNDEFLESIGDSDLAVNMIWRGSMKDCASVLIVSCALAKDFGAVISYEGEPPEPFENLLEATREAIAEAKKER